MQVCQVRQVVSWTLRRLSGVCSTVCMPQAGEFKQCSVGFLCQALDFLVLRALDIFSADTSHVGRLAVGLTQLGPPKPRWLQTDPA